MNCRCLDSCKFVKFVAQNGFWEKRESHDYTNFHELKNSILADVLIRDNPCNPWFNKSPEISAMKKITLLFAFALVVQGLCAETATIGASDGSERVLGTVELLDVIKSDAKPLAPGIYKLSREWVVMLDSVEDPRRLAKLAPEARARYLLPGQPHRFSGLKVEPDGTMRLVDAQFINAGRAKVWGENFRLMRQLRSAEEIIQVREPDTLKSWLGDKHGGSGDAHVHGDVVDVVEHWWFFSLGRNGTIVCQSIGARVASKWKPVKEGGTFGDSVLVGAPWVEHVLFSEGVLRPANPDSKEERRMYPSVYEQHLALRAKENARIDVQPEPLRSFLHARLKARRALAADDPDVLAYEAAINRFRGKPDPQLVRQLVERLADHSVDASWVFDTLMNKDEFALPMNLAPWKPENKKAVVEALIDALPEVPRHRESDVIAMILAETSLVALKMDEPEVRIDIKVFPKTPATSGYGHSTIGVLIKRGADRKAVLNRVAGELRRRWEASGFCVERYSAPAAEKQ